MTGIGPVVTLLPPTPRAPVKTRFFFLLALLGVLLGLTAHVHASPPQYRVTVLGGLGGGSFAIGVNSSGQVAGYSYDTDGNVHAVVWNGTTPTVLNNLGLFVGSAANGINDSGQVAGTLDNPSDFNQQNAVVWNGTTPTVLKGLPGTAYPYGWAAYGINASGQVVGYATGADNVTGYAVVWNGTTPTPLGPVGNSPINIAYAINASGVAVGFSGYQSGPIYAVVWNGTTPTVLPNPVGGNISVAIGINARGQVVGREFDSGDVIQYAVEWNGTVPTIIGSPDSIASGINDSGDVVGLANATGPAGYSFLYTGGTMYDLSTLLVSGSGVTNLVVGGGESNTGGSCINNSGQIAASGRINGHYVALLLTPILTPPPQYIVTILSPDLNRSGAAAINDAGQVAGGMNGHAVVWNEATPTFLGIPDGYNFAGATGINASGQIVGSAETTGGSVEAVIWNGTTPTVLGAGPITRADAISASGQVAGANLGAETAVFWNANAPTVLPIVLGGRKAEGFAINASGVVAGEGYPIGDNLFEEPLLWFGITPTVLGYLGGSGGCAFGINDAGVGVGYCYTPGNVSQHAVMWNGTTPTDLGTLGGAQSQAYGINNAGEVVGSATDSIGNGRGFLYTGGTMYDLNSLIAPGSGVTVESANGINNRRQIVGNGISNGQEVAILLTPISTLTPLQSWRYQYYGGIFNTGNAADTADPYSKGIANLPVFAFAGPNQDPSTASIAQLPKPQMSGENLLCSFTQPAGVSGVTYGAEWSATLLPGSWTAITDTGTAPQHTFSVPIGSNTKLFLRLRVTEQ